MCVPSCACSYSSNPSLGDAHSVEVEMAFMRHTMRVKEAELYITQGKVQQAVLFICTYIVHVYNVMYQCFLSRCYVVAKESKVTKIRLHVHTGPLL